MTASERLARWRRAEGITQKEAARRAGMSQPSWSDLESGRAKRVTVAMALRVERLTGGAVRVSDWATGDDRS